MKFELTGIHYEIAEPTKEFLSVKLDKLNYADDLVRDAQFTLTKGAKDWKAETKLTLKWGTQIHLEETAFNLHEAIEKLVDRLDMKVSKEKGRVQDHHRAEAGKGQPEE